MRPDWYDKLSPEAKADWDETEYDPDILGGGKLAIIGGGAKPAAKARETPEGRVRRGHDNAAGMTFGLLKAEVLAVNGGWCDARMLDGEFTGWLCPHVHRTAKEAEECPEKESILARPSRPWERGIQDCREPDIDWGTGRPCRPK